MRSTQRNHKLCVLRVLCGFGERRRTNDRRPTTVLIYPVDLRLLQFVGVIDVNRLPLGVEIDRSKSAFAVSITGGLHPTKRQVNFGADGWRVNIRNSGVQ